MRTGQPKEIVVNLEQQKKQARELLRAIRAGDAGALARLRRHHLRWAGVEESSVRQLVALHDAQFVLAREQGFSSWPKLKAYAEPRGTLRHTRLFVADMDWLAERAIGLLRTRASAGPAALEQIREWHPKFRDLSDAEILAAPFTEEDARLVYAREHGFETWEELASRVNAGAVSGEPFLAAFRTLEAGDAEGFVGQLGGTPGLAFERGTNGNTLLHLAVSLAGRGEWRGGLGAIAALLAAGADVNEGNDRGLTALHQAAYSNKPEIAELLLGHGAGLDAEAHGAGGTPLVFGLFWGHREVADLLGRHSAAPGNLRTAAGLGDLELVERCFDAAGKLTPEACAARGFYRPHSGFPDWMPSADPQEVLDEALVWACKSGRVGVLERLVRAGARVNADPYRGTPLVWAAFCNRAEAIGWLLDHGAEVNLQATFGGATHGQGVTALHMAAQNGHLGAVKLLVERGADLGIRDDLYHATAEGGANHFGQLEVRDYLRSVGGNWKA